MHVHGDLVEDVSLRLLNAEDSAQITVFVHQHSTVAFMSTLYQ